MPKTIPKYAIWNTEIVWRRILFLYQNKSIHNFVHQTNNVKLRQTMPENTSNYAESTLNYAKNYA